MISFSLPARRWTCVSRPCFLLGWLVFTGAGVSAQTPSGWLAHDMDRPVPPVVTPAPLALPVQAPADAKVLLDGTSLKHWRSVDGEPAKWVIRDDYMESVPDSGKLLSAEGFGGIQLHVEWAAPSSPAGVGLDRGNSAVFLIVEYEVQILDSFRSRTYADGQAASVYGQYPPLVNACLPPGEWHSYEILFRRPRFDHSGTLLAPARLDVIHNGIWVHCGRELWGPTSWLGNDPYEAHAERLPLALQDHGNPIRFRNIWVRELLESTQRGPEQVRPHHQLPLEDLARLAGSYLIAGKDTLFRIYLDGTRLQFRAPGRRPQELVPAERNKFYLRHTAGHVTFYNDTEGECERLTFILGGKEYQSQRITAESSRRSHS